MHGAKATHRADRLGHLGHHHDDRKSSSTKGGNSELVVDVAELCLGVEYSHIIEFRQQLPFHFCAEGVLSGKERETVGMGAERTTQFVIPKEQRIRKGLLFG